MTCDDAQLHLGGYVLTGLDADEDAAVREHLTSCPVCRHEYERLRRLPELLAITVEAPPPPPPILRERVLTAAAAHSAAARRRARSRRALQLVAAVLLGAVLGGVAVWSLVTPAADSAVQVVLEPAPGYRTEGSMRLRPTDNGVAVDVDLRGLPSIDDDEVYEVWFAPPDSGPLSVGTFRPDASGAADVTLSAAGPIDRYESVWITLEPDFADPAHDGPTVVDARLP